MKPKYLIFFTVLWLSVLFVSCAESPALKMTPSRITPQPSITSTFKQTDTPTPEITTTHSPTAYPVVTFPSPTYIPTPTPLPTIPFVQPVEGINTTGPYLFYGRQIPSIFDPRDDGKETILVAMELNARGQVVFTLPNQGHILDLSSSVSKDGEWVAYYIGTPEKPVPDGHYSLSLHLYQWKTGKDIKITDLISKDFPKNFIKIAQFLKSSGPVWYKDFENLEGSLQDFFNRNIYHLAWSPDGRYLAFVSEKDGPSSDIYLYALHTGEIRRLTDGPANIEWLIWTPDSQKIFHSSGYTFCEGVCGTYYVVDLNGKTWDLDISDYGGINIFTGWVSNNQMSMFSRSNGPRGPLRYVNIDTGEDHIVFDKGVESARYDKNSHQWLVNRSEGYVGENAYLAGWFLLDPGTKKTLLVDLPKGENELFPPCDSQWMNNPDTPFVIVCLRERVYLVHLDGSLTSPIEGQIYMTNWEAISPDNHWLLANNTKEPINNGWNLFNTTVKNGKWTLEKTFLGDTPTLFSWRPDSLGFFYKSDDLYYYSLETQKIILVDNQIVKSTDPYADFEILWMPAN